MRRSPPQMNMSNRPDIQDRNPSFNDAVDINDTFEKLPEMKCEDQVI